MKQQAITNAGSGDVTTEVGETVVWIKRDDMDASPTNPRKLFAEEPLRELALSIIARARRALAKGSRELGVESPLWVRLLSSGRYEVIAGERRWRASELAMEMVQSDEDAGLVIERLMWLPTLVKVWDDDEVIEAQLLENLKRSDLTPLEEADGYAMMIARGNTPQQVAAKIGGDVNNVYRALKWVRLPELARAAFSAGEIGREHATLIARIPSEMARRKAALHIIFYGAESWMRFDDDEVERMEKRIKLGKEVRDVMPIRRARELIAEQFMSTLDDATFALNDAELMPEQRDAEGERQGGGACLGCPFHTRDNPLFADLLESSSGAARSANLCTLPSCKKEKLSLQWQRDVAAAKRSGARVIEDKKELEKIFEHGGGIRYGADYVDLEKKPDASLTGHANQAKVKTWGQMLKGAETAVVLAQDGQGRTRHLLPRKVAIAAVNAEAAAKGKATPLSGAKDESESSLRLKEQAKKQAEEKKKDQLTYQLALGEVMREASGHELGLETWKWLVNSMVQGMGMDGVRVLAQALCVKPLEPSKGEGVTSSHYAGALCKAAVGEGSTTSSLQALLLGVVIAGDSWRLLNSNVLKEACERFGVSLVVMKNLARDEMKAKKKGKVKPEKKGKPDGMGHGETVSGAEVVYDADEEMAHYYCDGCGKVCDVPAEDVEAVARMVTGEFECSECDPDSWYAASEEQAGWEPFEPSSRRERGAAKRAK